MRVMVSGIEVDGKWFWFKGQVRAWWGVAGAEGAAQSGGDAPPGGALVEDFSFGPIA